MSGAYERSQEMDLMALDDTGDYADHSAAEHDSPEESAAAVQEFMRLPTATQEQVRAILRSNEKLQFVEKPSRWRSTSLNQTLSIIPCTFYLFLQDFMLC